MKKKVIRKKSKLLYIPVRYIIISLSILFVFVFARNLVPDETVYSCANSQSCIKDLSGEFDSAANLGIYRDSQIKVPDRDSIAYAAEEENVLGETSSNKKIYVDLSAQRLYAKEGDAIIHEFPISSGKWGQTPTGTFNIWIKLRYTRMAGGKKELGTYYNLPNVPYTMYFYNDEIPKYRGYGIHGAYWHNNFGHPMSHGCINMKPENAGVLYGWATPVSSTGTTYASDENPGTQIVIYGVAPRE